MNSVPAFTLSCEDPGSADALALQQQLSDALLALVGDAGAASFDPADVRVQGGLFGVARDAGACALGCGALRPLETGVAELKRMYAVPGNGGVGTALLRHLEAAAAQLGYREIKLSTRRANGRALAFYERHGYRVCDPYGRYVGRDLSVCLAKRVQGA